MNAFHDFFLCCQVDILNLEHTVSSIVDVVHGMVSSIFSLILKVNFFSQKLQQSYETYPLIASLYNVPCGWKNINLEGKILVRRTLHVHVLQKSCFPECTERHTNTVIGTIRHRMEKCGLKKKIQSENQLLFVLICICLEG